MDRGNEASAKTDLTQQLPLFALPDYTLFPHTLVPFRIYDQRYRRMVDSCLAGRRLLVVCGVLSGGESERIGGLGRVLSDRRYHDGRYDLFVHCLARVEIESTHQDVPVRLVNVQRLEDELDPETARLHATHQRLVAMTARLAGALGDGGDALRKVLGTTDDPAVLSNRLASLALSDPGARQHLLEIRSPLARCELLCDRIGAELVTVGEPSHGGLVH